MPEIALSSWLVAASAFVLGALGTLHLVYTFHGPKLTPRDDALREAMQRVSPVITRETTMWKAWIGFNASHSYGAMLYGLIYGYLALAAPALLFGSIYLRGVGLVLLAGYVFLGKRYFFSVPFGGILIASALYVAGLIVAAL